MTQPSTETEPNVATAPSSQSAWRAHAAVFCAASAAFCNLYCLQALVPLIQSKFGVGVSFAASLLTVTTLGLALSSPITGRIATLIGTRAALLTALAGLTYSTFAIGLISDQNWLVFWRIVQGILIPIGLSAVMANTSTLWPAVRPISLAATYTSAVVLSGLVGRFLPAMLAPLGWTAAFAWFAVLQLVLGIVVFALFPKAIARPPKPGPLGEWLAGQWQVVQRDIPHLAIGGCVLMISQAAITSYAALRMAADPFNWSTPQLGALYLVFLPALLAVRLTPMGIQRFGSAKLLLVAILAAWVGQALSLVTNAPSIIVGLVIFSASVFVVQTVFAHQVGSIDPRKTEMASSAYLACYYVGASAGSLLPSYIWADFGWPGCVALVGISQICGLVIARKHIHWSNRVVA